MLCTNVQQFQALFDVNIIASCLFSYVLAWKVITSRNYMYVSQLSFSIFSLFFSVDNQLPVTKRGRLQESLLYYCHYHYP